MSKYEQITGGNGITGQTGGDVLGIINNQFIGIMADKEYIPADFVWTASLSAYTNTIMVITHEHDLSNANITLPANSILLFEGGKLLNVGNLVGNSSSIINDKNLQCFNNVIEFTGSWINSKISPQAFGAVCTPNPKTIPGVMVVGGNVILNRRNEGGATSSSAAIQKVFDSPFQPYFPPGYYYITATTIIRRSVYVDFGTPIMEHIDRMSSFLYRNDHVRFYTDQNIKFWELRHNYNGDPNAIYLIGGVMDVQLLDEYSETIYYVNANYKISEGEISGQAIGSKTAAKVEFGVGTYFHWDTSGHTIDNGYIWRMTINAHIVYINRGIIFDQPSGAAVHPFTWSNSMRIDLFADGTKVAADISDGGLGTFKIVGQSRNIFTANELTTQHVKISSPGSEIAPFVWDITSWPDGNGFYTVQNNYAILINGANPVLTGAAMTATNIRLAKSTYRPKVTSPINHTGNPIFLAQRSTSDTFFSELHNFFNGFHKNTANTVSFKAYEGGAMNFDTELRDGATIGLTESSNYTITFANNLFEQRGTPSTILITDAANRDTDFLEIVLSSTNAMQLVTFYISVVQNTRTFKKVQLICVPSTGPSILFSEEALPHASYRKDFWEFNTASAQYVKFIIRLIGSTTPESGTASGLILINDIAAKANNAPKPAYVPALESVYQTLHVMLNQTGTTAPTIASAPYLNTCYNSATAKITPSMTYNGIGDYTLTASYAFPAGKVHPTAKGMTFYTALGSIVVKWISSSAYSIKTYNTLALPSNEILEDFLLVINTYW